MELKSIEDWVLEKQFKSVPNVVDVSSFGGMTREYQVAIDPDKLVSYGLNIGQVEQQLANNNVNAGGSFVEAGMQQINVRAIGLVTNVTDIQNTLIKSQNGTPMRSRDIAMVSAGPENPPRAKWARRSPRKTERLSITTTWWKASCCCARARTRMKRWTRFTKK